VIRLPLIYDVTLSEVRKRGVWKSHAPFRSTGEGVCEVNLFIQINVQSIIELSVEVQNLGT